MMTVMALPVPLPKTITTRFKESLMRGVLTYVEHSDVTVSRFIQRAVERELTRLGRNDQRLKTKLEKVMKNGTTISNDS